MIVEIYPVGKCVPMTTVECDKWEVDFTKVPRLICYKGNGVSYAIEWERVAEFFLNNIAGFKEIRG